MIKLTMFSSAEKVKGQGVASAYRELVNLVKERLADTIELTINQRMKADITHYHTIDLKFYISTFFKKKRGIRVGYVHFLPETLEDSLKIPPLIRAIFYKYLISFYKRMDEVVVVNPSFSKKLEAYHIPKEKIHYIPNFVSKKTFYKIESDIRGSIRAKYGFGDEDFVVMGVGQVQHRKGVLDFIEVAAKCPDIQFVWAGGFSFGKMTAGYEELKKIYDNPPENVKFIGIIERTEMNACFNMADVFFMPSYNELFPMAILEAMNCELPVVLRNLTLYEQILAGYYTKAEDINGFIRELRLLKDSQDYYEKCFMQAKAGAAFYSEERLTELWRNFYTHLAKERDLINEKRVKKEST